MLIVNEATNPPQDYYKLVKYVASHFPKSVTNKILLMITNDIRKGLRGMEGLAINDINQYQITIQIGKDFQYPRVCCYRKKAGIVIFLSKESEFVHFVAHEFQHAMQFHGLSNTRFFEVEAEIVAKKITEKFNSKLLKRISGKCAQNAA